jgi:hypothetical protein
MQCEKKIGPVDAPNVTGFSEQCDDVSRMIDFQQKSIVAAIFVRLYADSLHGEESSAEQRHLTCRSSQLFEA